MITGICRFGASALRRRSPKADGFAFRCRSIATRPLRHLKRASYTVAIEHQRDRSLRSEAVIAASGGIPTIESP
jgi:hypothetical protein